MSTNNLSPAEITRYSLQIALDDWGREAQEKIKSSRVLIAGGGGLATSVALHLLSTGVGALRLVDPSRVSLSDLNTATIYRERDLGKSKASIAERRLKDINPFVLVEGHSKTISENNVHRLVSGCNLLIDAMKSPPAGPFLNQAAVKARLPLVHARVWGMDGLVTTFWPSQGPCLICAFPEAPPTRQGAIMGPVPGIIGALQAFEALRILGGVGPGLVGRVLVFKGKHLLFKEETVKVNPQCRACRHLMH